MAPHGAVTFVSGLYAGSISDRELFKQSGIIDVLTPDMAIMVDKGFLIDNLVPCKIHRPAFVTKGTQMSAGEVRHTQSVARLRVHVERLIRRVKEHKLFDAVIPLSISGSINQLFAVSCTIRMDHLSRHGPSESTQCHSCLCTKSFKVFIWHIEML